MDQASDNNQNPNMPQLEDHSTSTSDNGDTGLQEDHGTSSWGEHEGISSQEEHNSTDSQGEDPMASTPIVQHHRPRCPNPVMESEFMQSRRTQKGQKAGKCNVIVF